MEEEYRGRVRFARVLDGLGQQRHGDAFILILID